MKNKMMNFVNVITEELKKVEIQLNEEIASDNEFLSDSLSYILKPGGKRLRPALLLLSSKACNFTENNRDINLACALELIHTATLIHDDVIDEAKLRRNKQTLNSKYDNKLSILLGDYLYSKAVSIIVANGDKEIMEVLAEMVSQMCEGEILQNLKANSLPEEQEYLNMINKKTANFFSCCCKIGGLIASAPPQIIDSLTSYGFNLGTAFQITDDVLDLISNESFTGKSTKNDLLNGKFTLPVIYAAKYSTPSEIQILTNTNGSGKNKEEIIKLIAKYGGFEYSQHKVESYIDIAKQNLNLLNNSPYKDALIELAEDIRNMCNEQIEVELKGKKKFTQD